MNEGKLNQHKVSTGLLIVITLVGLISVYIVYSFTKDDIEENQKRAALFMIEQLVKKNFDNDIYRDTKVVDVPSFINPTEKINVYVARKNQEAMTSVLTPVTFKGYGGLIQMAVGIDNQDAITGIYILEHNETQGFGAAMHQDQSDWLRQFEQTTLSSKKDWAIKLEGGNFDQISGATITSRSVIDQLYLLLDYYKKNKERFKIK